MVPPTPEALHYLVTTIPAKTLHSYVLAHIPTASPDTLVSLASFFATLAPPPLLYCVRCHADYTGIHNGDSPCFVPHDDDSVEVKWVDWDCDFKKTYGCCGRQVEGEGDLGPLYGWCYEGVHTVSSPSPLHQCGEETPVHDILISALLFFFNAATRHRQTPTERGSVQIRHWLMTSWSLAWS